MRLVLAVLFACGTGLCGGAPVRVAIDGASVTLGPGREPPPGSPPYVPRLDARFTVTGPARGTPLPFRFWRLNAAAVAALRADRPLRAGDAGVVPVSGLLTAVGPGRSYSLSASTRAPWAGPEFLAVEVLARGRLAGRGVAPILEKNLPATGLRNGSEQP